jgi:hypothetical protein
MNKSSNENLGDKIMKLTILQGNLLHLNLYY